jgi:hypothetical protein
MRSKNFNPIYELFTVPEIIIFNFFYILIVVQTKRWSDETSLPLPYLPILGSLNNNLPSSPSACQ